MDGYFVHPLSDPEVMAGNGTIGLEILEDLPDVDAVIIPYGGGGLSTGIASAMRALKPDTRLYAAEVETAAPLARIAGCWRATGGRLHRDIRGWHRRPAVFAGDVAAW